jgi:hypothetical protein
VADQRKSDEYAKDRFEWIDQVMADPKLPASASKVAYVIATNLWRNKGTVTLVTPEITASDKVREAWIGTRDIADKIAMSRFTVMDMVDRLEERGHLEVKRGRRGRGHANHYRLVRKGAHTSLLDGAQAKPKANGREAAAFNHPLKYACKIIDLTQIICASPEYLARHGRPLVPSDLTRHRCLILNGIPEPTTWMFNGAGGRVAVEVSGAVSADSSDVLLRLAVEGVGIVRLGELAVARALRDGSLGAAPTGRASERRLSALGSFAGRPATISQD